MPKFYLTQTALKDLENEQTCPYRWKAQWLDGVIPFPSNEHMDKGKYFEQLVLGSGAISGDSTTDLPRLKNGSKSAEHLRIDEQATRAKRMLFDASYEEFLGFTDIVPQVELIVGDTKGTLDFKCRDKEGNHWLVDLKLTADASSDRTKYGYGNDWESLDLLQLTHYQSLYELHYGILPKVGLLVLDYSIKKRAIFGEINISEARRQEKTHRFNTGLEVIELYQRNGWVKDPSPQECSMCPLTCVVRFKSASLEKRIINY